MFLQGAEDALGDGVVKHLGLGADAEKPVELCTGLLQMGIEHASPVDRPEMKDTLCRIIGIVQVAFDEACDKIETEFTKAHYSSLTLQK